MEIRKSSVVLFYFICYNLIKNIERGIMKKYLPFIFFVVFIFLVLKLMTYNSEKKSEERAIKYKVKEEQLTEKLKYDMYYDRIENILSEGVNGCETDFKKFVYEAEDELWDSVENKNIFKIESALYNYKRNLTDDTRILKDKYKSLQSNEKEKELIDIEEEKFYKELEIESDKIVEEYYNTNFSKGLSNIYKIERILMRGYSYCIMMNDEKDNTFRKFETEDGRKIEYHDDVE